MKEYKTKIREDYGSRIARPKIDEKAPFELKSQFLKELRDNTFSGLDNKDANKHIENVLDIVDLFHIPNMTQDQIMLRVFLVSLTGAASRWLRNEPTGLKYHSTKEKDIEQLHRDSTKETMEILRKRRQTMKESLNKFMVKSAKRHDENSNLIKEIRASMDVAIRNQGASIKALEIQIGEISKVLQEKGSGSLPGSTETNPKVHVKSISTTVEADTTLIHPDLGASISVMPYSTFTNLSLGKLAPTKLIIKLADRSIKRPKGIAENLLVGIDNFFFPVDFIVLDMPEDIKVSLIIERPFLSTAHAKIDVFKRKFTLRVGDDKIVFKSDNPSSNIIRRVYALGLREQMELDLEAGLIGEALILNTSLYPVYGDYIKLNDLNEQLELRRNQVKDLGLTIEEGEIVDEPMEDIVKTRNNDNEISNGIDEYPSFCDFDRKIHINCAYNLQFLCMIDAYRDHDMGEVIMGEPFCREIYVKARRFDRMITIYHGNESVSAHDKLNGISHPYQKLKIFYKGVLNLGPEYIRDAKIEELLTRGHMCIHEMG
uniref:Reverse transcriptase domain-containing protein n=1 Tax=Tanacetum cinerariifolium TaxID=118510 RepID=A0A6L2J126_TANCI|nr:hypothetical protein [Tanacetum cinerariifolium]